MLEFYWFSKYPPKKKKMTSSLCPFVSPIPFWIINHSQVIGFLSGFTQERSMVLYWVFLYLCLFRKEIWEIVLELICSIFHHICRKNYLTVSFLKILELEDNFFILQLLLIFEKSYTIHYLPWWYKITFPNVLLLSLSDSSAIKFHPIKPCKFP